tara:strand:- start:217 stop:408 length:192 start_codon:yes stop_codon:yes gene_type:complete
MEEKINFLKKNLVVFLNMFHEEIKHGNSIDDISLEDLDEFAEILDNYLDFRTALAEKGSYSIQ